MDDPALDPRATDGAASAASSTSLDGGRFAPGVVLSARYRITGLLGRGGMGEVYRAEDLTLGEHVALKFLPLDVARDPEALARLHREVRTSRQITHRNVVRVHDVGEVDGQPFLSMEFVRGEDLASLLRRIGRLPEEKGVSLARQICAGLAAAHEQGVLHRDLKPANVMVDEAGNAKLTDFGLAALTEDAARGERVGTPAYMAPEQFAQGLATRASDIFSLGLVLHEVFTGERAIQAATVSELTAAHRAPFQGPAARVSGIDPAIDGAIRRCLALEPTERPASALVVAGALPGGDPLAQALAAGETPSPELVARAEGPPALPLFAVLGLFTVGLLGFAVSVLTLGSSSVYQADGTPLERAVLEHQARELTAAAGAFELAPGAGRFEIDAAVPRVLTRAELGDPAARRPGLVQFVYRAGDAPIAPRAGWFGALPTWDDPPPNSPGTVAVRLDSRGRLIEMAVAHRALPEPASEGATPGGGGPWFEAAGLEPADFTATEPQALPPVFADEVASWEGGGAEGAPPLRVDAGWLRGHLVWWSVRKADQEEGDAQDLRAPLLVFTAMLLVGGWFAVRNVRAGRADERGATAMAVLVGGTYLSGSFLAAPAPFLAGGPGLGYRFLSIALLFGAATWSTYAALEPALRRTLPSALRSWNRLLRGGVSDPFVHRDLLLGVAAGLFDLGLDRVLHMDPDVVRTRFPHGPAALQGVGAVVASVFHLMLALVPIALFFLFGAPRLAIRHGIAADILGAALVGLFLVGFTGFGPGPLLTAALIVGLARCVGFLALFGFALVPVTLQLTPFTWDTSLWWSLPSLVPPGLLLATLVATAAGSRRRVGTAG